MRILVGIDGSVRSERALCWALQEARLRGARVTVLHVFRAPSPRRRVTQDVSLDAATARTRVQASAAVAAVGAAAVDVAVIVDVAPGTVYGSVAHVVLRRARTHDLVVVGARGLGGFAGLLMGSVSQQVVAHAPVPVTVVPSPAAPRSSAMSRTPSIVVGVDGSPPATTALRWAVQSAMARRCPVVALYAYPPPSATLPAGRVEAIDRAVADGFWTHGQAEADKALGELVAGNVASAGVRVDAFATPGPPALRLLKLAVRHDATLVLGARGRGGFAGLLLGSVTSQCVHHSTAPVIVVH